MAGFMDKFTNSGHRGLPIIGVEASSNYAVYRIRKSGMYPENFKELKNYIENKTHKFVEGV